MGENNLTLGDVFKWRDDAIVDGWSIEPSYPGHEHIERAARLQKAGYTASIITREDWHSINIWGPDGLAIQVSIPYSMDAIILGMSVCSNCGTHGVDTVGFSFAGRCCYECLPEMRKKHEYPGWYN
jgi:hypothetical protein